MALLAIGGFSFQYYEHSQPHEKYWETTNKVSNIGREIASIENKIDPQIFDDFLSPNTYSSFIKYDMQPRFWSNLKKDEQHNKAFSALDNTFLNTYRLLATPDEEKSFIKLFKENFVKSLVETYIRELDKEKINEGEFQLNLNFTPKEQINISYNEELSTNQLINFDDAGSLYDDLLDKEPTLAKQVIKTDFPVGTELYQYVGGSIAIDLKLKQEKLAGFVRYRRYFKINYPSRMDFDLAADGISSKMLHFKKNKEGITNSRYITVDVIKNFNQDNLTPKAGRIEIYYGDVISNQEKAINTSDLIFTGEYSGVRDGSYKASIEKLVYDFETKKFSNNSVISTTLRGNFDGENNGLERDQIKKKIKRVILEDHARDLVEKFRLARFDNRFKN
jgi:hypothetical protein